MSILPVKSILNKFLVLLLWFVFIGTQAVQANENGSNQIKDKVSSQEVDQQEHGKFKLSPEMQQALNQAPSTKTKSDGLTTQQRLEKYLKSGFVHIIPMGIDHILFVLGLFLAATGMRSLFLQVTLFTLAHSVTLGLSAAGYIGLSSNIVEPLIALSIAYIAFENIKSSDVRLSRYVLVFAFGLLHGLGFAFVLRDFGIPDDAFISALLAFNVGVELGQLSVIGAAFLLSLYWREKPNYRKFVVVPLSTIIGVIGVYWTVERLFF